MATPKLQLHGAFPSKAGDSAYQIAQKNGFEGTEKEWLASLVGPQGPQGPAGVTEPEDFPTLLPRKTWVDPTEHSTITEVRFVENYNPTVFDATWDAGVEPGSITAYREGNVVTVSANGKRKIKMNANSAAMFNCFYELRAIKGLEILDASDATNFGGMFVYCKKLTEVDMSMWHCGEVTSIGGMFQYCSELRSVKMPHGLNRDTLSVTASTFEECHNLREVDMGPGPISVGDRMFAKCVNLEHVTGLSAVTTIGTRAFVYCAKLKDIDLNPAILTSIGESAFRLSSVEDCINLDDLNTSCVVADYATRTKRWSDNAVLTAIRTKDIPTVFLSVPHADSQLKYTDVKFAYKDGPWDEDTNPEDVSIARGGCSALSLYHEWQCIHKGTELEKANFLDYWKDFEGDKFADINTDENMPKHFPPQAAMLGWGHEETFITSDEQYDVIIDRLNKHLPTCVIMHSTNIDGYHAVVIIGADTLTRKLAVLDSAVTAEGAVLTWAKFEDIFTDAADGDRLVVHTFGDSYRGYEPPEYIPTPTTASVGQTMAVKAVDADGKPTQWEAVDMAGGGSGSESEKAVTIFDTTTTEEVMRIYYAIPAEEQIYTNYLVLLYPVRHGNYEGVSHKITWRIYWNDSNNDFVVETPNLNQTASTTAIAHEWYFNSELDLYRKQRSLESEEKRGTKGAKVVGLSIDANYTEAAWAVGTRVVIKAWRDNL